MFYSKTIPSYSDTICPEKQESCSLCQESRRSWVAGQKVWEFRYGHIMNLHSPVFPNDRTTQQRSMWQSCYPVPWRHCRLLCSPAGLSRPATHLPTTSSWQFIQLILLKALRSSALRWGCQTSSTTAAITVQGHLLTLQALGSAYNFAKWRFQF